MSLGWDLLQSTCDEAEPVETKKRENKGKRGWRVVKNKELKKIDNWKETEEESGNNGLENKEDCSDWSQMYQQMEKKKLANFFSIRVSFIFFNLHPMFWFCLGFFFHFELVF